MPGMLGNHQDFLGNGEPHPKWDRGEGWSPYYSVFTDPLHGNNFWKFNNGVNTSYCPEMSCDQPTAVVATVTGFNSPTRIREGAIVDISSFLYLRFKSQDCYAFRDENCVDFGKFNVRCDQSHPQGLVFAPVAGRYPSLGGYDMCAITDRPIQTLVKFDYECLKEKNIIATAGFWADFAGTLLLWAPNGFNGGIPYSCTYSITGNVALGGRTLFPYEKIDLSQSDSAIQGYYPAPFKSRIHYTSPNFFNTQNRYNGYLYGLRPYTWSEIAGNNALKKVLNSPGNSYSSMGFINGIFYDADNNGTYICHKQIHQGLRPELIAKINRTKIYLNEEAELIYEVGGREKWSTAEDCCLRDGIDEWIADFDYSIGEELGENVPQPEGKYYCIDYACGPRRASYYYRDDNGIMCNNCYKYYCTERIGTAKPHLAIYTFNHNNYSAQLELKLKPSQWMIIPGSDTEVNYYDPGNKALDTGNLTNQNAAPYSWIVDKVDIVNPGEKYKVGDFFYVDFNPFWFLPFVDGQIINVFPDVECCDPGCLGRRRIGWTDKYGYFKRAGSDIVYQRIRVSEVDEEGGIVALEIVPWFKTPEFKPGKVYRDMETGEPVWSLCQDSNIVKKQEDKTPFYVEYLRVLCHPNSVRHPGKGYSVGDTITWDFAPENSGQNYVIYDKWKDQTARATVVDVDEEGGILDWYIGGSDRWKQYGLFNLADNAPCYTTSYQMAFFSPINQTLERDNRGRYRFLGHPLCDLSYMGIGVPVRTTPIIAFTTITGDNGSVLTSLSLNVIRENCKTTAGLDKRVWPFTINELCKIDSSLENGCTVQYKDLWYYRNFPPYPQCYGGGFETEIIFGSERANDSVFGSTVKSAKIISKGAGYAYKEKKHVAPNLLKQVPDITSLDEEGQVGSVGSGAEISFNFIPIHNFPNPFVLKSYRESKFPGSISSYDITHDRFSYFRVDSINVDKSGKGYKIGQRFDVWPIGRDNGEGGGVTDFWTSEGGDNPDIDINGSWYDGIFAQVDIKGYMTYIPNSVLPTSPRQPQCTLEISKVDQEGGIVSIKVIHGGMMFRPVWTEGKKHPDVFPFLDSSLGYGAIPEVKFNLNIKDVNNFGSVLEFYFRGATVDELPDPYFPYSELKDRKKISGNAGLGYGRDYANPSHGYFWRLQDTSVGYGGSARLLAYYDWGLNHKSAIQSTPLNYYRGSKYETHEVVKGSRPPFVPMTTVCSFNECYHELLNKTYPLYRTYYSSGFFDNFDCGAVTTPFTSNGVFASVPPKTPYCVARRKFRLLKDGRIVRLQSSVFVQGACDGDIKLNPDSSPILSMGPSRVDTAGLPALVANPSSPGTTIDITGSSNPIISDYVVVEYGMNLRLSTTGQFATNLDHKKGRTTIVDDTTISS